MEGFNVGVRYGDTVGQTALYDLGTECVRNQSLTTVIDTDESAEKVKVEIGT